jgi:predicted helicase
LSDPYVKAIRWASDRIEDEGIVAFVTNNSFVNEIAFDGMRKHLVESFDEIYILDLGGNVRKNPKLSGSTHNVFGIQIGVSINLFIRKRTGEQHRQATIYYAATEKSWRKEQKYRFLEEAQDKEKISWRIIHPDKNQNWLTESLRADFDGFLPIGSKVTKQASSSNVETVFKQFGLGVKTGRDDTVYDWDAAKLLARVESFADAYNAEIGRYLQEKSKPKDIDEFVNYEKLKWSRNLKRFLSNARSITVDSTNVRTGLYRPFSQKHLYFSEVVIDELGKNKHFFPKSGSESNKAISATGVGAERPFAALMSETVPDLNFFGPGSVPQWFPFYTYNEDGTNRRENITDWALEQFRSHYKDKSITKWDIFHYVYAVLHHPLYRERYAANLKRELPRVPFAPDFRAFADIGKQLTEIHVDYEQQPEYPLERIEKSGAQLDWRVERMKLSKDKRSLIYNDFLTLGGIPPEVFEYRLGNRSALEWIIDQYQVSTDKRSGITNDPNRADDPQYIVRLVGQVCTVSLRTFQLVQSLAEFTLIS